MCVNCHSDRIGESWETLMAKYRLRNICTTEDGWEVDSASGASYNVQSVVNRSHGESLFYMRCDCPARKHCRHIDAVMNMRYAEELAAAQDGDVDGIEIMERTEA